MQAPCHLLAGHPLLRALPLPAGPVHLRALNVTDIEDFLAYRSDPEVARCQGWESIDRDDALAFLRDAAPPPWNEGDWAQIGIARSDDDRLVGDIGLLREGAAQVQLGFSLARSAQGRGWARAALRACIEQGLVALGVTQRRGIAGARNTASLRLLQRQGFAQTACVGRVFRSEPCTEITLERSA